MGHKDMVSLCKYERYSLGLALEEDMEDKVCGNIGDGVGGDMRNGVYGGDGVCGTQSMEGIGTPTHLLCDLTQSCCGHRANNPVVWLMIWGQASWSWQKTRHVGKTLSGWHFRSFRGEALRAWRKFQ